MNRTDRLMGIIILLQSRKFVLAENIAEHFSISVRTVYSDLKAINEIGVPVGFESGKGYFSRMVIQNDSTSPLVQKKGFAKAKPLQMKPQLNS